MFSASSVAPSLRNKLVIMSGSRWGVIQAPALVRIDRYAVRRLSAASIHEASRIHWRISSGRWPLWATSPRKPLTIEVWRSDELLRTLYNGFFRSTGGNSGSSGAGCSDVFSKNDHVSGLSSASVRSMACMSLSMKSSFPSFSPCSFAIEVNRLVSISASPLLWLSFDSSAILLSSEAPISCRAFSMPA